MERICVVDVKKVNGVESREIIASYPSIEENGYVSGFSTEWSERRGKLGICWESGKYVIVPNYDSITLIWEGDRVRFVCEEYLENELVNERTFILDERRQAMDERWYR